MKRLLNYFLQGVALLAPLAVTAYICYTLFEIVDGWLGLPVRGAGFVVTIVLITVFGFLASNLLARTLLGLVEAVLSRLPFVRLLYTSTKDLFDAFVGEKRRFDQPVLLTLSPDSPIQTVGFVTQDSLAALGLPDRVAVYLPFSYSVAGHVLVVPRTQITPLAADASDVMAFLISGGVTTGAAQADGSRASAKLPSPPLPAQRTAAHETRGDTPDSPSHP